MKLKSLFCLIGNYLPPKLNCYFYKLAGVKFNISKVWIGNKCYFDVLFPENITINDNVCITTEVTIICHFDPERGVTTEKPQQQKQPQAGREPNPRDYQTFEEYEDAKKALDTKSA